MRDAIEDWPTGRLLSTAARLIERRWSDVLADAGLSHAGLIVLHLLDGGPLTTGELARRAHVQAQTMTRTVEHLERDGCVRRVIDPADRRRRVVERTPEGARRLSALWGLEAQLFPDRAGVASLRAALLSIIRSEDGGGAARG
jgi:DNA-binding MarR family transcriptional regulator